MAVARVSVSIPVDLYYKMKQFPLEVNWSAVAAIAFSKVIENPEMVEQEERIKEFKKEYRKILSL